MTMPPTIDPAFAMHLEWRAFLAQHGAVFDQERVAHFGDPDGERRVAAGGDVLADLSQVALLCATGTDAQNFLQGQLSNDIREVGATRSQLSGYCNPKGRLYAILHVWRRDDAYYLQLPAALAEATLKRLRMFVLRAQVKLEPADPALARIGLSGPNAEALVREALGEVPAKPYDCLTLAEITVIRLPGPQTRYELLAPSVRLAPLWQRFAARAKPVGAGPWAWLDIQAGIPTILPGTVEEFVPQMTNLELVGGVSFTKGCYPGQEIVARMHYLGRLKQRMLRAHVESPQPPAPGTPLFAPDLPGQSTGAVLDAQPAPQGGYDLLAVAHLSSRDAGELHLLNPDGPRLVLEELPYPLAAAASA